MASAISIDHQGPLLTFEAYPLEFEWSLQTEQFEDKKLYWSLFLFLWPYVTLAKGLK